MARGVLRIYYQGHTEYALRQHYHHHHHHCHYCCCYYYCY